MGVAPARTHWPTALVKAKAEMAVVGGRNLIVLWSIVENHTKLLDSDLICVDYNLCPFAY